MTIKEFEIQLALGTLSTDMKYKLAKNPNTSKKILKILSKDENWNIRDRVADNLNTPKEVLTILSKDEYWVVKNCVARNHNTPKEILAKLSTELII